MKLEIDDNAINSLQVESIKKLMLLIYRSATVDIHVRKDAKDSVFEGDWLCHLRVTEPYKGA